MTNLEKRLRKLEAQSVPDGGIVIEVEYVNEPPKSDIADRPRVSQFGPRLRTVHLSEDDLKL